MVGKVTMHDSVELDAWSFTDSFFDSGTLPAPTLHVYEGDTVQLNVYNASMDPHTLHLHGLDVDQQNDGVPGTSFEIEHQEEESYTFVAHHAGNYFYHCHVNTVVHLQMGMYGMIIVHSNEEQTVWNGGPSFDYEYIWQLSEIDSQWHINTPENGEITAYNPDYFLVNGKSEHQLEESDVSIVSGLESDILLRLGSIGYGYNKIVFPSSLNARIISSDGRPLPEVEINDTLYIYPGERYSVLLNGSSVMNDSVSVSYFSMQDEHWNTQWVPVQITSDFDIENNIAKDIKVYPNPTSDYFTILMDHGVWDINIYNIQGEKVLEYNKVSTKLEVETNLLPAKGSYIVHLSSEDNSFIKQVVVY
jgi:FtsP/CotA-like multicopper oxidase with cupredoxin domain